MKISKVTPALYGKASALLRLAFPGSHYEEQLVEEFHNNGTPLHEWVCIHANRVIAYIAFSNAYHEETVCGLHLAPLAVNPDFQNQGVGSELLHFALRQEVISKSTLYVLGKPDFYRKLGFELCTNPVCPFDKNNAHFLSLRNNASAAFTVGYEGEFDG